MRLTIFVVGVFLLILGVMGFLFTEFMATMVPSYGSIERGVVEPGRPMELPFSYKRPIIGTVESNVEVTVKVDGDIIGSGSSVEFRIPPGDHVLRIESELSGDVVVKMRVELPESWYLASSALVVSGVVLMFVAVIVKFLSERI